MLQLTRQARQHTAHPCSDSEHPQSIAQQLSRTSGKPVRHAMLRKTLLGLMVCTALAACGGSGGGGSTTPNVPPAGNGSTPPGTQPDGASPVRPTAVTPRTTGSAGPAAAAQAVANPLPQGSTSITFDRQASPRLWVVNADQNSVSVFDASTRTLLKEITVGEAPRTIAIDNAGHAWVANRESGTLSIIDPASLEVSATIELSAAAQPYGVIAAPDGSGIWVALSGSEELLQLDPVTRAVKQRVSVGPEVRHLAIDAASSKLLASRYISPALPGEDTAAPTISGPGVRGGEVMVIDAQKATILHTVNLAVSTLNDTALQGRGLPNYLVAAAISPDGKSAWVPSKQDNILRGKMRDNLDLDFENSVRAVASRIDLSGATAVEQHERRIDFDNTSVPTAAAYTPDGKYMLVALETSREVAIINASTGAELGRYTIGLAPQGVAISADGKLGAISNALSRTVSFMDLSPLANDIAPRVRPVSVPAFTSPEKLPANILRGKQLFHDSRDPRLGRDNYLSCASCHNEGYGDGRIWDMSGFGEGLRKTISLRGHGGKKERLHWSGNFDEVQDFDRQIRELASGGGLMLNGDFNHGTRAQPLGDPKAGISADLDALAAYVNSLNTYAPSPFRPADRSLSPQAKAGEALFSARNCQSCHLNQDLGGTGMVLENIGTLKPTSRAAGTEPLPGIVAPGLRDAWYNAPYLHDGSAATLDDAIKAHNNVTLTAAEISSLSAYVRELGNGQ
ncbi:MAG: cytochrome c peroxidase [Lautropia sp.]|nr:cytochrome c peroxidase [Lautropia sp.]